MNADFDPCGADPLPAVTADNAAEILNQLLDSPPCPDIVRELRRLAIIIDLSEDLNHREGLQAAMNRSKQLINDGEVEDHHASLLHYFLSNAWEATRLLVRSQEELSDWEQPELEKQIVHLRWAVQLGTAADVGVQRLCQIHTNLGNWLDHCGRVVEAIAAWDAALCLDPNFGMALGNRGLGLLSYATQAHDPGHQAIHLRAAHRALLKATQSEDIIHGGPLHTFTKKLRAVEEKVSKAVLEGELPDEDFTTGWSNEEKAYRQWSLKKRLFLNDLNDIDCGPIAAADVLTLPSLTTPLDAGQPSALGFFNQLKQEYVSARYLYFSGTRQTDVHFSDRDVTLIDTLDYPTYGLSVEMVKMAFRVSYSLFDKIAYFLNDYLDLGIPQRRVSFRGLWYRQGSSKKSLREDLGDPMNQGLKALFWLSKDLYVESSEFADAIEPEAREIAAIRNHLEHKYLKLHEYGPPQLTSIGFETLAYSLSREDFERKALRLLQLARAALIYLVHAIYAEETRRNPPGSEGFVGPMVLDRWEDDWKL